MSMCVQLPPCLARLGPITLQQAACVSNTPPVNGDGCGNGQYQCSSAGKYCLFSQGACDNCAAGSSYYYCPNACGSYAYTCPTGKTSLAGAASCH
eukprot:gene34685-44852_t